MRIRIIESTIANAKPAVKEFTIWDSVIPGFGYRVRPGGAGSAFIYTYRLPGAGRRGAVRRVTLKADKLTAARLEAKKLSGEVHGGKNPAAERKATRETLTVAEVLDEFVADHVATLKPSTAYGYKRAIEQNLKPLLGTISITKLSSSDVASAYRKMSTRGATHAALCIRVLRSAMTYARREKNYLPDDRLNPASINLKTPRKRERLFSDAEVARLHAAIDQLEADGKIIPAAALALRLLFATGCRSGEILNLQWSNVDFESNIITWTDSKTGAFEKSLTDEARALLEAADRIEGVDLVCANGERPLRREYLGRCFERAMAVAGVEKGDGGGCLHLIRHYFATATYTDASIPLSIQMKIVGHRNISTAMGYAHPDRETVAKATQAAADKRKAALVEAGKRGKVIALRL